MKLKKRESLPRCPGRVGLLAAGLLVPVLVGAQAAWAVGRPGTGADVGPSVGPSAGGGTDRADLDPIGGSGVKASIQFVDNGTTLMVIGIAKGLDPSETYLSNIYDIRSVADGPDACAPAIFDPRDPDFILPRMFLGFWAVSEDGVGKLFAIKTRAGADHVPLDKIGTVSVRLFVAPPRTKGAPPETKLVACGQVGEGRPSIVVSRGRSDLRERDGSGVKATIRFVDDGTTLTVTGTAKGLDPGETYLSNIYDLDSVADGPDACAPAIFDPRDPDFILPKMFLGFWTVDEDGVGKLFATNTNGGADHVPLDKIGTVSVRLVAGPPTMPGGPPETKLVACGSVSESPGIGQSP